MEAISGGTSILLVRYPSSSFHIHRCIVCPQSPSFDKAANGTFKNTVSAITDDHAGKSDTAAEDDSVIQEGISPTEHTSKKKLDSNMRKDWDDCGSLAITSDVYGSQCPPRSDLQEILIRFALPHLGTLKGSRQSDEVRKDHSEFEYEVSTALTERLVEMEKTPW
ncbi:hypothetical protein BDQ94DRAFT_164188 [Aspergillus welwitschiae]|uniref:BTB domain-containing protein n=1 Tax=Aspergillus welwitschiae TaxID=1341132 RepID=A0A3F3PIT9_9EURO|nr:hypothetical protein BDQ94DRAFT_164188 [Aspergillus welwitschiae]RDH26808.1 hypothetical protein BDQ94DRAFT_164188 [Aspergillus welwitschiae]